MKKTRRHIPHDTGQVPGVSGRGGRISQALVLLVLLLALLSACSSPMTPRQRFAVPPYHGNTLSNFTVARLYMSQGRYELARQHLLLALATSRDEDMRTRLATELESVEMMIATMR